MARSFSIRVWVGLPHAHEFASWLGSQGHHAVLDLRDCTVQNVSCDESPDVDGYMRSMYAIFRMTCEQLQIE